VRRESDSDIAESREKKLSSSIYMNAYMGARAQKPLNQNAMACQPYEIDQKHPEIKHL
jgi:hypothetical protein